KEQRSIQPADPGEEAVMIHQHDANREKARDVGGVLRPGGEQRTEQLAGRSLVDLDVEDQERDRHREDPIAERLDAPFAHGARLRPHPTLPRKRVREMWWS